MQQDMRYVYEVYKQKSFSKAAQALFITQPALSIAIGKLEDKIGMPIFDRSTRPISLTTAGRVYLRAIERTRALRRPREPAQLLRPDESQALPVRSRPTVHRPHAAGQRNLTQKNRIASRWYIQMAMRFFLCCRHFAFGAGLSGVQPGGRLAAEPSAVTPEL